MLSIALCTFNGEKYLAEQLQCFSRQIKLPDELVVCDDGSKDATMQILYKFRNDAPFKVNIFRNNLPLGITRNFEKAIGLCSGDIIFLSDQDDLWKQNKIQSIYRFLIDNKSIEAVFSNGDLIDEKGVLMNNTLWDAYDFLPAKRRQWESGYALNDLLYNRNKVTGATLAIRKKLYNRMVPFEVKEGWYHDQWIAMHAAANNALGFVPESLILYRIHPDQQVGITGGSINNGDQQPQHASLSEVLEYQEIYYSDFLKKLDAFFLKYPNLNKHSLQKEATGYLSLARLRRNLPGNIFSRLFKIIHHYSLYKQYTPVALRSMIRDLLQPVALETTGRP